MLNKLKSLVKKHEVLWTYFMLAISATCVALCFYSCVLVFVYTPTGWEKARQLVFPVLLVGINLYALSVNVERLSVLLKKPKKK